MTHELALEIEKAVREAIKTMGLEAFKKTSFFISAYRHVEMKKAA
jgi:hypothetical protein